MHSYPKEIKIVEVGPRDGLQNEAKFVPTDLKIQFINDLIDAGITAIETTSFVSPKWIPQMADHTELMQQLPRREGVKYLALVPNAQGLENALAAGVKDIAVFTAASETFTQKNINASIAESLERFASVAKVARANHIAMRGYISCVLGCPYEGAVPIATVIHLAQKLLELGCYEVSLGDTIGVGTALGVENLLTEILKEIPARQLAVHFHDTYGQALANILTALHAGITTIDSATAGLGGCPYAKGASGNVATEDVLYLMKGLNIATNINLKLLANAGSKLCDFLGKKPTSKVNLALGSE